MPSCLEFCLGFRGLGFVPGKQVGAGMRTRLAVDDASACGRLVALTLMGMYACRWGTSTCFSMRKSSTTLSSISWSVPAADLLAGSAYRRATSRPRARMPGLVVLGFRSFSGSEFRVLAGRSTPRWHASMRQGLGCPRGGFHHGASGADAHCGRLPRPAFGGVGMAAKPCGSFSTTPTAGLLLVRMPPEAAQFTGRRCHEYRDRCWLALACKAMVCAPAKWGR